MKHTFVFIDKLMILLKFVPRNLDTGSDKNKAEKSLILIEEYTAILRKLIESHKTEKYLDLLHKSHIQEVEDWSDQVDSLFKKLDSLLKGLDQDAKKLSRIIKDNPEQWQPAISDMALGMVMTGLHDEEENMNRLRKIAVFEIQKLEQLIEHERHVQGLHFWQKLTALSEEEQIIEHEKYFVGLLS